MIALDAARIDHGTTCVTPVSEVLADFRMIKALTTDAQHVEKGVLTLIRSIPISLMVR